MQAPGQMDGYGFAQPQELSYEEQVELAKKEQRRAKRKLREVDDNRNAFRWILALGFINAILWVVCLFGNSWHRKKFFGFGIGKGGLNIHSSLMNIEINLNCDTNLGYAWLKKISPEQAVCKMLSPMSGVATLKDFASTMCIVGSNACPVANNIFYSSFIIIVTFALAALFDLLGCVFLYYYWYSQQLGVTKDWARWFFIFASLSGISGFIAYSVLTPDIGAIPMAWNAMVGELGAISESHQFPFGWCWMLSVFSTLLSAALLLVWMHFFKRHVAERAVNKDEKARKKAINAITADELMLAAELDPNQQASMLQQGMNPGYEALPNQQQYDGMGGLQQFGNDGYGCQAPYGGDGGYGGPPQQQYGGPQQYGGQPPPMYG